jgi:hypothetical protein
VKQLVQSIQIHHEKQIIKSNKASTTLKVIFNQMPLNQQFESNFECPRLLKPRKRTDFSFSQIKNQDKI